MRIVHVSSMKQHPCFSDVVSLQSKHHEIIVIVLNPVKDPTYKTYDLYVEDGIQYIFIYVAKDLDFSLDFKLENYFAKLIESLRPDVLHIQLFSGINVLVLFRACRSIHIKKIITLHVHSLFCLPGVCFDKGKVCALNSLQDCSCDGCHSLAKVNRQTLMDYNQKRLERLKEIIALSDAIICCSRWQQDTIRRLVGDENKTRVLYYGVTIHRKEEYRSSVTRKEIEAGGLGWSRIRDLFVENGWGKMDGPSVLRLQSFPRSERGRIKRLLADDFEKIIRVVRMPLKSSRKKSSLPLFGYLGSLWSLKGIDQLLNSVERNKGSKFQLIMAIALKSSDKKEVQLYQELKKYSQIKIITNVNRGELYEKFFSQIDYLIIPSVWEETGPMTLFEAFYYKVPVIISRRPSIMEKTTEGVNSLVYDNEEGLSELMGRIIKDRKIITGKKRGDFPVKSVRWYTVQLDKIYSGKNALKQVEFDHRFLDQNKNGKEKE